MMNQNLAGLHTSFFWLHHVACGISVPTSPPAPSQRLNLGSKRQSPES